jgi:hypothetical protein
MQPHQGYHYAHPVISTEDITGAVCVLSMYARCMYLMVRTTSRRARLGCTSGLLAASFSDRLSEYFEHQPGSTQTGPHQIR